MRARILRDITTGLKTLGIILEGTSLLGIILLDIIPLDIIPLDIIPLVMVIIPAVIIRLGISPLGSMLQVLIQPCRTREAAILGNDVEHVGLSEHVTLFFNCLLSIVIAMLPSRRLF
jgi:hypothetical protein